MSDSHVADVQAELQQYLNSKNINGLFIQIVESLLIEKPANPVAFMIEYLFKQFPDQAKAAGVGGPTAESKTEPDSKDSGSSSAKGGDDEDKGGSDKKDTEYSDSEDEDEDEMGEMEEFVPRAKPVGRRVSVSAESMDPKKLKEQQANLVVIEKSPEISARLLEVVSMSPLLRTLDDEQRDNIVKAFSGPLIKEDGEDIIVEGDIGDVFYLLEEGSVDVYVSKAGDSPVHTYQKGASFGELALMYNAPRAATCRSKGESKLWALDRTSFKVIVVAAAMQKREKFVGFLQKVPILESLTETELMTMADSMAEEKYNDGDVICTQGDAGDFFYIVHEGKAICKQKDAEGSDQVVAELESGNYFGEIALLTQKPRQATVVADGALKVLSLDKATFTRVMGPMDDIMKRNMENYNKYTQ